MQMEIAKARKRRIELLAKVERLADTFGLSGQDQLRLTRSCSNYRIQGVRARDS